MKVQSTLPRLFNLFFYIQKNPGMRTSELAKKYSVSTRTIIRDFHRLEDAGVPHYSEGGKHFILNNCKGMLFE